MLRQHVAPSTSFAVGFVCVRLLKVPLSLPVSFFLSALQCISPASALASQPFLLPPKLQTRGCGKLVDLSLLLPRPLSPQTNDSRLRERCRPEPSSSPRPSPKTKDPRMRETCRLCLVLPRPPPSKLKTRGCGKLVDLCLLLPRPPPPN